MANLVAKIMVKMKLIKTDKVRLHPHENAGLLSKFLLQVVFVNNALDLLAGYAGQTPGKVDAKVSKIVVFAFPLLRNSRCCSGR